MGNSSEYLYGPVTDYSIKTNMSGGTPGRGWTWGIAGSTPVAAINTLGNMQIAGTFTSTGLQVNLENSAIGIDAQANARLGFIKNLGPIRRSLQTTAAPLLSHKQIKRGYILIFQGPLLLSA